MYHGLVILYQVYSNEGPRVQDGPVPGGPKFEPYKYIEKILKNLRLQSCLGQVLEMLYVALPGGLLSMLSKPRSEGPRWPWAWGS